MLIAQFHAAEVEHAVLHRGEHLLAAAGRVALIKRGDNAEREMQARAGIADLRAADDGRAVVETGRRCCAARALRDVLVDLAVFVGTGAEALHRRHDHLRVQFLDSFPREAHAIERAGCEVLDQHVAFFHERFEDLLAFRIFRIDGDRTLVVVEHREVEAVGVGDIAQLLARDVACAGALYLDDIGAEPCEQLRAGRAGLNVREIEDTHTVEGFAHCLSPSL